MSRYLIQRIEETPAIVLRPYTVITALEGGDHLECVHWRDNQTGTSETHAIRHVFAMTGAVPNTRWLQGCVALDAHGFIKTGADLPRRMWPPRVGHWPGLPTSLKRVCPVCSRSATSGAAISNVWRRQWGRARLPSPSCIRCSTHRRKTRMSGGTCAHRALSRPFRNPVWHAMSTPPLPPGTLRVRCRLSSAMMAGRPPVCSWGRPADVPSPRACARRVDAVCPRTAPETRPGVPSLQQLPIIRHFFSSKCKQCQWFTYGLMFAKVLTVNGRTQPRGQERDSADDLQDCMAC